MYIRNITIALLCSLLSLTATNAELVPRRIDLAPRQAAAASSAASSTAVSGGTPGGQAGSAGGTGDTGSNGAGGIDGAAATLATALPSSSSVALAGARATGDARLWVAGVGAGLVGVVGGMI